jgi:beta-propeller repeat-containing protein
MSRKNPQWLRLTAGLLVAASLPVGAQSYHPAANPPAMLNPLCGAIQVYACDIDRNASSPGFGRAYLVGANASTNQGGPNFGVLIAAFDAPGNLSSWGIYGSGQARAVAVDSQGALVVATTTGVLRFPVGGSWSSYANYAISGVTPQEIAFDTADNVYVTGYTGVSDQIYTVRLDKTVGGGLTLASGWPRTFGNSGGKNEGRAIGVKDAVYVAGTGYRAATGQDALILKYPLTGGTPAELWYDGYIDAPSDDGLNDLAVDAGGNVFAAGYTSGGEFSGFDYLTLKLTASSFSTPAWLMRYDAPGQTRPQIVMSNDKASFIALDPAGSSVFVTGSSTVLQSDIVTMKYSAANGAQLATWRFDGASNDSPSGLFVSSAGQVFVGGLSSTQYVLLARTSDLSSALYGTPSYVNNSMAAPAVACLVGRNTSGAPALFAGGVSRVSSPPACDPGAATGIQWVYP